MNTSELIYDWNQNYPAEMKPAGPVLLNDESLRDGLQSPSVRDPSIRSELTHLSVDSAGQFASSLIAGSPRSIY